MSSASMYKITSIITSNITCSHPRSLLRNRFTKMGAWLRNAKPYLLLLAVQFGSAGMFIFAMDAIKKGMSHYVFIVYRNAIATVTLVPFAFYIERSLQLLSFTPSLLVLIISIKHFN